MGGTLLLADDSITIQKVVELTFAETDHKVVAVGNGRDLFARLAEVKPDVVLCDVVMPDINGYEVCQTLKSDPNTLHLPVVLLTGTFEPFDRDRALAAGCDAIVTKPFEARELITVVEDLLKRAQSVAALPMPGEGGGIGEHGIPEGVPSLDYSTTGFDQLAAQIAPPPPMPEVGIELTSSALGDSAPSARIPAPPELAEPETPPPAPPAPQAFAFGGEEAEAPAPAPMTEAFAPDLPPAPAARPVAEETAPFEPETPAFAAVAPKPEAPRVEPAPAEPANAPEPFAVRGVGEESAHELFAPEPAPAREAEAHHEPVFAPASEPVREESHVPRPEVAPPVETPAPAAFVERAAAAAAPLAVGAISAEVVEHVMRRVKEMIPHAASAAPTAAELLTDEHVDMIARRAAALVPPPPAPPTAAELLTDEHVERVAMRAAQLVPPLPAPSAAAELSDAQVDKVARRVLELAAPQLERVAWEVIPDIAEMIVRKRIEELEKAAEEES